MNRILLEHAELDEAGRVRLDGRRARHVLDVLKAVPGQTVRVGVINGPPGTGTVLAAAAGSVTLDCAFEGAAPPAPAVDVLLALPRPKVLRRLWPALASLGVGRIVLVNAAEVDRCYFDTHWLDPAHYRPLLLEGLEQSGDTRVPDVQVRRRLKPFVEDELDAAFPEGLRMAADPRAAGSALDLARTRPARALVAVGPEGGWTPFELDLLARKGFVAVTLGWRTLRSDTAAIALVAMAHQLVAQRSAT